MSFNIPSFIPNQIPETWRVVTNRGFQSPVNVALAAAISLTALYTVIPAFNTNATKQIIHPSLGTLVVAEGSRLAKFKELANKVYPLDTFGEAHSVDLLKGKVTYWLMGPQDGKRVVLIHGISIPSLIWKYVAERLAKAGFRVLIYDLYGRGYSEAPDVLTTPYDTELYTTQLALLMQAVGWRKARIGGGIAAAFAATFPWLVEPNVALIAPAGVLESPPGGLLVRIFGSVTFQRFRHSRFGKMFLPAFPAPIPNGLSKSGQLIQKLSIIFNAQTALLPGYSAAIASSMFVGPVTGLENEFKKMGNLKSAKVLLIWGAKDRIIPYACTKKVKELIPHAVLITIEDAGHDLTASHYDRVAEELIKFLKD